MTDRTAQVGGTEQRRSVAGSEAPMIEVRPAGPPVETGNKPQQGRRPGKKGRIGDIELLRAVAVIFVIIQHAGSNLFPWGGGRILTHLCYYFNFGIGVDLFFAISGFVIARSLLPDLERRTSNAGFFNSAIAFWVRRAWRLLPSAWLWLALILLAVVFFNRSGAYGGVAANIEATVTAVLNVANFRFADVFFHYDPGASFPYWSLSLEEQFYILLPLLAWVAGRRLPYVMAASVLAQFFIVRSGEATSHFEITMSVVRSDALCLGVLIAIWSRHPSYRLVEPTGLRGFPLARLAILAILLVCLASFGSPNLHLVSFSMGMVALISAALVLIASFDGDYLFPNGMVKRAMLWIGSRSYALYLIHIPVYYGTRELWFRMEPAGTVFDGRYTLRFTVTALLLLLILAELNYRFIETPLRRRGARISKHILDRVA
jgi:peptidoglycan/LPS O-acetylase OafA/YrhL